MVSKSLGADTQRIVDLVRSNGGGIADSLTSSVTFVVGNKATPAGEAKALGVPGVTASFVDKSVEIGELQGMESALLWGEPRRFRSSIAEAPTSRFVNIRGVNMDADVGESLLETSHVLVDRQARTIYSETLSRTDLVSGSNSFYILYVLESNDDSRYWVWRKWGRIGTTQGDSLIDPKEGHYDRDTAIKVFSKQYFDKTGNKFGHKPGDFVAHAGKLTRLQVQHEAFSKAGAGSGNGKDGADGGGGQQPLGKLTKVQVEKGDGVLDKIDELLSAEVEATDSRFLSLSAEYYNLVPHNFGLKKPPTINSRELLDAEKGLIQLYLRMGFEEMDEADADLTPIDGLMNLPLPKTLLEGTKGICPPGKVKECTMKGGKMAKAKAGRPLQAMDPDLYGAILLYTSNAIYKQLNKALRDEDREQVQRYFPYLRMFFEACERLEKKERTLWRGVSVDLYSSYKVGAIIIWWGVSSCTSDEAVAQNFMEGCGDGATLLTIETKTACDIQQVSFYGNEAESLLMPGTKLEVLSSEKKGKNSAIRLREVGRVIG